MMRQIHVPQLHPGSVTLSPAQAHHLRDVLRLEEGAEVELFDDHGAVAVGTVITCTPQQVIVQPGRIRRAQQPFLRLTVAAAVPKSGRADWMIEKLSELGTATFIPLVTARSVVRPEGKNKLLRWQRIATEAARQSRRPGIMHVEPPAELQETLSNPAVAAGAWYLSPAADAMPIRGLLIAPAPASLALVVGPEGGWTAEEVELFAKAGLTAVKLTETILRVETAAVAAAAIVVAVLAQYQKT